MEDARFLFMAPWLIIVIIGAARIFEKEITAFLKTPASGFAIFGSSFLFGIYALISSSVMEAREQQFDAVMFALMGVILLIISPPAIYHRYLVR